MSIVDSLANKIDSADNLINTIVTSSGYNPFEQLDALRTRFSIQYDNKNPPKNHPTVVYLSQRSKRNTTTNNNKKFVTKRSDTPMFALTVGKT